MRKGVSRNLQKNGGVKYFKYKTGVTKKGDSGKRRRRRNAWLFLLSYMQSWYSYNLSFNYTKLEKLLIYFLFFLPDYYPCSVVEILGRYFGSVRAAFLTNLKVVICEAIYWRMIKISEQADLKKWGIRWLCPKWIAIVSCKSWWEE